MPLLSIYRKIFFFLITLTVAVNISAQEACGCKEGEQLRTPIGMYFNSGRLDSAEFYIKKFLGFNEKGCKINFQGAMAQVALAKKDYTHARVYLEAEEKLLRENACNKDMYVRHYSTLTKLYQELNLFDSVVITCLKGIEAAQTANDYYGLSRANADIASVFSQMGQKDKAIFYDYRAIDAARKQTKVPSLIATVQTRLSEDYLTVFESSGNKIYADSAALIAKEALDTAAKYHDLLAFLEANDALARHSLLTNNYKEAIVYADVIISSSPRGVHLLDRLTYRGFSKKSEALYKQNDFGAAEQFADSALLFAQSFNPQMMVGAYERIYLAAKANNNTAKSLTAHEKMVALNDSLFTIQKNAAIAELEKKYNQAKNEKTIQELAQQRRIYILLALAGLLALIGLIFFIRQQTLKSKQKILETEQRLNRARMNPHFFFNALSSLQTFALQGNDGKSIAANLSKFSHIMRETLESTYKEYITIEQESDFLREYLELQKIRFPQKFTYEIKSSDNTETEDLLIPAMIVQPFVENSIEHGFRGIDYAGHISIHFDKGRNDLEIKILDNGKGMSRVAKEDSEHISRASQIIKDRIYLLNRKLKTKAAFSIENNSNEKGVTVFIQLPLLYKQDMKA
jgi:anti-sigma regulatory factor (Ser/Thr protein kinase)